MFASRRVIWEAANADFAAAVLAEAQQPAKMHSRSHHLRAGSCLRAGLKMPEISI